VATTGTPKCLLQGTLLANAAPADPGLYKVAAADATTYQAFRAVVHSITLCNTDTATHLVTLYLVASGGSVGVLNTIVKTLAVAAGGTLNLSNILTFPFVLETGDFLSGFADTGSVVSIRMDGEVVPI